MPSEKNLAKAAAKAAKAEEKDRKTQAKAAEKHHKTELKRQATAEKKAKKKASSGGGCCGCFGKKTSAVYIDTDGDGIPDAIDTDGDGIPVCVKHVIFFFRAVCVCSHETFAFASLAGCRSD